MAISKKLAPLSQRITGYPQCAPQTSVELINTDYDLLKTLEITTEELNVVVSHRRDLIDVVKSYEKRAISSPEVVLDMLENNLIRPVAKKWLTFVLTDKKERKMVPHINGIDMAYQNVLTKKVPTVEKLSKEAPLPKNGAYLLIYGGSPGILSMSTVPEEIRQLHDEFYIADVLFWHLETGQAPTLYSLRKGQGDRNGSLVQFPDMTLLKRARS